MMQAAAGSSLGCLACKPVASPAQLRSCAYLNLSPLRLTPAHLRAAGAGAGASEGHGRGGGLMQAQVRACSAGTTLASNADLQAATQSPDHTTSEVDLKQWMIEHGLPPCKVDLLEKPATGGCGKPIHYVVASEDLQPGDVALAVPNSLVVTLERVLGDESIAELLTTNKLSELACLALYLMYEKKRGKESFWYPYIRELDRQRGGASWLWSRLFSGPGTSSTSI